MKRSASSPLARYGSVAFQSLAIMVIAVLAIAALGSCAGERPTLGALALTDPGAPTTTTTARPVDKTRLGPDDLLGWIATPTSAPEVFKEPSTEAERIEIGAKTWAGAPTTFAVVGDAARTADRQVAGWYQVALPSRPNGSTGWVPDTSVTITKTPFRIFIDLRGRTLRVEKDDEGIYTSEIAVGTEENPTPTNGTYVTELIANTDPDGAYGPYAFGLAMHSDTLTEFNGGPGQVGIHGTNQPALIGQAVSHGCVRLTNAGIEDLVDLELPLGVPVFIT